MLNTNMFLSKINFILIILFLHNHIFTSELTVHEKQQKNNKSKTFIGYLLIPSSQIILSAIPYYSIELIEHCFKKIAPSYYSKKTKNGFKLFKILTVIPGIYGLLKTGIPNLKDYYYGNTYLVNNFIDDKDKLLDKNKFWEKNKEKKIIFIEGTSETCFSDIVKGLLKLSHTVDSKKNELRKCDFSNDWYKFNWNQTLSSYDQYKAGKDLVDKLKSTNLLNENLLLIGHSNGGNVVLYAVENLLKENELPKNISIATIATPFNNHTLEIAQQYINKNTHDYYGFLAENDFIAKYNPVGSIYKSKNDLFTIGQTTSDLSLVKQYKNLLHKDRAYFIVEPNTNHISIRTDFF
jgi:hypothetical protein